MNITTRLADTEIIIIDGAMGTELQRRDVPLNFEIWSAAALLSHPHLVQEIHVDYIRAGAEIQIAATITLPRTSSILRASTPPAGN